MGFEYRLEIKSLDQSKLESRIKTLSGISQAPATAHTFEYRPPGQLRSMPDAVVSLTGYGLYFCANSTAGKEFLGIVVCSLASEFEVIAVSELD